MFFERKYDTVLFDIDDTLVNFSKSAERSLVQCYQTFFSPVEKSYAVFKSVYDHINQTLWRLVEENTLTSSTVGTLRFEKLAKHYAIEVPPTVAQYYEEQLVVHSEWIQGADRLLDWCKSARQKMGFVTNGFTRVQKQKCKNLGFSAYSEVVVISEEVGWAKPHPRIFEHALQELNSDRQRTLVIGDSLLSDGRGARNAGIAFCWYNPQQILNTTECMPDYTITSLEELRTLLTE